MQSVRCASPLTMHVMLRSVGWIVPDDGVLSPWWEGEIVLLRSPGVHTIVDATGHTTTDRHSSPHVVGGKPATVAGSVGVPGTYGDAFDVPTAIVAGMSRQRRTFARRFAPGQRASTELPHRQAHGHGRRPFPRRMRRSLRSPRSQVIATRLLSRLRSNSGTDASRVCRTAAGVEAQTAQCAFACPGHDPGPQPGRGGWSPLRHRSTMLSAAKWLNSIDDPTGLPPPG